MSEGKATEVYFYHLERRTLDDVLPTLLELSLKRGWRAAVQAASEERVEALDTLLWTYRDESFLPMAPRATGRPSCNRSISPRRTTIPTARRSAFSSTAPSSPTQALCPIVYVFDGRDEDAVARARAAWQEAKAEGCHVSYWQQEADGRWQQKA